MTTFLIRLAVATALLVAVWTASPSLHPLVLSERQRVEGISFTAHTIDTGLKGGYQSVIVDLNRDGKLDVIGLASSIDHLAWYENPGFKAGAPADTPWPKHVMVTGVAGLINAAAHDLTGDGIPEVAVAHDFATVYAKSRGTVSILTHQKDPREPWSIREIDRAPTAHRLRWAPIDARGSKVLINSPLIGAMATAPDYKDKSPIFWYKPDEWIRHTLTDADEGVVHGITVAAWDNPKQDAVISASFVGIHAHQYRGGRWERTRIVSGDPGAWPQSGSSDVVVGRAGRNRFIAAIEPWHGNKVVVYTRDDGEWTRRVIDESIVDGHTIVKGDFDGDGRDEIVVGERRGKRSAYLYRATSDRADTWEKQVLDDGNMAGAGCDVGDLNGDKRPDIVCIGTFTANLKWYENVR